MAFKKSKSNNSNSQNKRRKRKKTPAEKLRDDEGFSLENVIELGGDESDYELLKDIDVEGDIETSDLGAGETDGVKKTELKQIIAELGLESREDESDFEESARENSESKKKKKVHCQKNEKTMVKEMPKPAEEGASVELQERLLVHPSGRWFEETLIDSPIKKEQHLEKGFVDRMRQRAESLWDNETAIYMKGREKARSSDVKWLKTLASSGTLGDKIASLAIQIQESPVHHMKTLDILLGMAAKKGRRECLMAIDTLKDLWLVNLLPGDRKLRRFTDFPLTSAPKKTNQSGRDAWNRKLILWYFEDQLKKRYEAFVHNMERLLHDNLENIRGKMLGIVYELLSEKPEQEKTLLLYLVNKVGDPNRKIASKAAHLLGCLVQKHPNMKLVITQEVERLLYRPNIGLKAQYYAICFLNQLILTKRDGTLAGNLVMIYFSLFKAYVDKGQVETKMLSALLSGVNRAFHYVQDDEDRFSEQVDMLFRVVHVASFSTSVQALMLLFQVMNSRQSISDRYYQALYAKLLDSHLQLSSKQAMFLNIMYKSLKVDTSLTRLKAFVKRLLQVCSTQQPSFICGVLYLLSEVAKVKPGIKSLVTQSEERDEEEHFTDVVEPAENGDFEHSADQIDATKSATKGSSPGIRAPSAHGHVFRKNSFQCEGYRAGARNPLYCGAEDSCLWEVMKLAKHFHPSVCRFAQCLLQGEDIIYSGDPLLDFTLMRFLDRFVYKNPKKKVQEHGGSIMQPKSVSQRVFEQPVNTVAFLNKSEENVREDETFFYRYFKRKAEDESKMCKKKKTVEDEGEEEEIGDESDSNTFGDADSSMDFARDFEKSQKHKSTKKQKKYSAEGSDEDSSDGEDFKYEDMDVPEDDLDDINDEEMEKYTDKDYEKVLLENLSSDEFSENEVETSAKKKRRKQESFKDGSMFASAEEFAHLLEDSGGIGGGGIDDVDMKGLSLKQQQWELSRMRGNSFRGGKFRGKRNPGRGAGQSGKRKEKAVDKRTRKKNSFGRRNVKRN